MRLRIWPVFIGPGNRTERAARALRRPVYSWSWLAAASPRHHLLIRHHLKTGEQAFHCYVPAGQPLTLTRRIRATGLRWPVEEQFRCEKDCFGLGESLVRLYTDPDPGTNGAKFSGTYAHRSISGGVGHNLPQEAPRAFAQAVADVDGY